VTSLRTPLSAAAHRSAPDDGFTLIEVIVAAVLLLVGLIALVTVFDSSRKLTTVGTKQQTAIEYGEQELERILSEPYASIALTAAPGPRSTDANNPDFYLTSGSPPKFEWNRSSPLTSPEDICYGSTGPCAANSSFTAGPDDWSSGQASGKLYRFVSWTDDPNVSCTSVGTHDFKRVTVALTIDGPNAPQKPVWLSTFVSNPSAGTGCTG
jgi:prepilin-type N-terminal cleavage/methylation domain-containing protein